MPLIALLQPGPWIARLLLAAAALATMSGPALLLLRRPGEASAQHYFNRASLFPPVAAACMIGLALLSR